MYSFATAKTELKGMKDERLLHWGKHKSVWEGLSPAKITSEGCSNAPIFNKKMTSKSEWAHKPYWEVI